MKQNFRNVALTTFTLFSLSVFSQQTDKRVQQKELNDNGTPSLIIFKDDAVISKSNTSQLFKDQLGLKQNQNLNSIKIETDELGFNHEKFQLFHKGIKVEFATYTVHSKEGKIKSMSGEFYDIADLTTTPSISAENALTIAKNHIGASTYLWENATEAQRINYQIPVGELVFLPIIKSDVRKGNFDNVKLAYKLDIYASNPISRGDLYVDATTGEVLFYNATIKHLGENAHGIKKASLTFGKKIEQPQSFDLFKTNKLMVAANAATRYSGTQSIQTTLSGSSYVLNDNTRGNGIVTYNSARTATYPSTNFTDVNNDWTAAEFNNTNKDNAALDAHWGAEKTFDYFSVNHARNGYNNAGAQIKSYVHYNLIAAGYPDNNNAFWDGTRMTYGDGGAGVFDALTSLDVAAHEIGHAVCSFTANLAYQKESGAMNEGFSDIWGACVEFYAAPTKQTWLIGEDIERRTTSASLRSMSNPNAEGQPDTYGGTFWINPNCTPSRNNDFCGVHTNSGVLNFWFYLLAVGKSGTNDIGNAYNVTGITIDKAAKIAYRLEANYLSANSTFANARTSAIQAATDLYGAGSQEVISTTNAWYAVGVGAAYVGSTDTTVPSTPTSLVASGTTSSSTNLAWNASTDNVAVTGYDVYRGTTLLGSTTASVRTYAVTGLTASTAYSFTVKAKDAANNLSAASNTVNVTTLAGSTTPAYCTANSTNTSFEYIDNVAMNGMTNVTTVSAGGYGNFLSKVANMRYGANTITFSAGFVNTVYTEYWNIWIDFNKNGTFDSAELVVSGSTANASNYTATITVPTTALSGNTRMRVKMSDNSASTSACGSFTYGEVEDYTVNIGAITIVAGIASENTLTNEPNVFDFEMYPNPTNGILKVNMLDNRKVSFAVYNLIGQQLKANTLTNSEINVTDLPSGVYLLEVNDGQKSISKKFIKE